MASSASPTDHTILQTVAPGILSSWAFLPEHTVDDMQLLHVLIYVQYCNHSQGLGRQLLVDPYRPLPERKILLLLRARVRTPYIKPGSPLVRTIILSPTTSLVKSLDPGSCAIWAPFIGASRKEAATSRARDLALVFAAAPRAKTSRCRGTPVIAIIMVLLTVPIVVTISMVTIVGLVTVRHAIVTTTIATVILSEYHYHETDDDFLLLL